MASERTCIMTPAEKDALRAEYLGFESAEQAVKAAPAKEILSEKDALRNEYLEL